MEAKYKHKDTNEIVKITEDKGNFYTLNNGNSIKKDLFIQKYQMINTPEPNPQVEEWLNTPPVVRIEKPKTAQQQQQYQQQYLNEGISTAKVSEVPVDPVDFLYSAAPIQNLEALNNVNLSQVRDPLPGQGTTVIIRNPDDMVTQGMTLTVEQKRQMIEENNRKISQQNIAGKFIDDGDDKSIDQFLQQGQVKPPEKRLSENGLTEEQEIIRLNQIQLTGEDPFKDKIAKYKKEMGQKQLQSIVPKPYTQPQVQNTIPSYEGYNQNVHVVEEDPSNKIFKTFKRNYKINIKLNIQDNISKPEFIKIMADGLEGDIVEFYTNEIIKNYLSDVQKIHDDIYNQLYKEVYGKDYVKEEAEIIETKEVKPKTTKPKTTKKEIKKNENPK